MSLSRRQILAIGASLPVAAPTVLLAQARELRLGIITPVGHSWNKAALALGDKLKAASNGRLTLTVFHSGQLGNEPAMMQQLQSGALDPFKDEPVEFVHRPVRALPDRRFRFLRRDERPVILPRRALLHPADEQVDLFARERLAVFRRRHEVVGIGGQDAGDQRTGVRSARHDGVVAGFQFAQRGSLLIQAQAGLAMRSEERRVGKRV